MLAGVDRSGVRAAVMYTLNGIAKLNDVEPLVWLADVVGRSGRTPENRRDELSLGTGTITSGRISRKGPEPARPALTTILRRHTQPEYPASSVDAYDKAVWQSENVLA